MRSFSLVQQTQKRNEIKKKARHDVGRVTLFNLLISAYFYIFGNNRIDKVMQIIKRIFFFSILILTIFFVASLFLSSKIKVERSVLVSASPSMVFQQVNVLRNWDKWDPWYTMDNNLQQTYEGEEGVNSKRCWLSKNPKVGSGCLTIVESKPYEYIKTELVFDDEATGAGHWQFKKVEEGTEVTWEMVLNVGNNPIGKFYGLKMDKMVGNMFEEGLNQLKATVESMPPSDVADPIQQKSTQIDSINTVEDIS